MASLEFFVPRNPMLRAFWLLHTRLVLPLGIRLLSAGWRQVGSFLGPSIAAFYRENSLDDLTRMWERSGMTGVRSQVLSLGEAVVMWGEKEEATR